MDLTEAKKVSTKSIVFKEDTNPSDIKRKQESDKAIEVVSDDASSSTVKPMVQGVKTDISKRKSLVRKSSSQADKEKRKQVFANRKKARQDDNIDEDRSDNETSVSQTASKHVDKSDIETSVSQIASKCKGYSKFATLVIMLEDTNKLENPWKKKADTNKFIDMKFPYISISSGTPNRQTVSYQPDNTSIRKNKYISFNPEELFDRYGAKLEAVSHICELMHEEVDKKPQKQDDK